MSLPSRRDLVEAVRPRYRRAGRVEKQRILDEFVATTGYHRKYAIYLLNQASRPAKHRAPCRPRARRYTRVVQEALVTVWQAANGICGKRLVPFLPELVAVLERHGELVLNAETKGLLLSLSAATADRLLRPARQRLRPHGLSTTKPGTLLKQAIPIRTFAEWDDVQPGFLEVDLVAHGGDSTRGEYLHTLVLTDICTGWTECVALLNRSQQTVTAAIREVRRHLPFPLLGLDSDNGSEFINANLLRYCQQQQITFTRSRPYKKNDQAHVEQKNWSVVRQLVGYDRYEGPTAYTHLAALYQVVRLYINFFQPVMKLVSKERNGAKLKKRYDLAQTPFQRTCASQQVSQGYKDGLMTQYHPLNPVALLRQIEALQAHFWQHAKVSFAYEATIPLK